MSHVRAMIQRYVKMRRSGWLLCAGGIVYMIFFSVLLLSIVHRGVEGSPIYALVRVVVLGAGACAGFLMVVIGGDVAHRANRALTGRPL